MKLKKKIRLEKKCELESFPDHQWDEIGQSTLSGSLLEIYQKLDDLFLSWAAKYNAAPYLFPPFIPAKELEKLDYFSSFPHLVTVPVTFDDDEENLKAFVKSHTPLDTQGTIPLPKLSPAREVLTPAACYHAYINLQGKVFDEAKYVTTRATCFRRETHYLPLQRQWAFSMREIICIGTSDEVNRFLADLRQQVAAFFETINLKIDWQNATDPFFNPSQNLKYLFQKLDPVKTEMVFQDRLAIGSVNAHRNYFGEAFQIKRGEKEAFSGCVAFGLERWIYTLLTHFEGNVGLCIKKLEAAHV